MTTIGQPKFVEGDKVIVDGRKGTVKTQVLENHTEGAVWGQVYVIGDDGDFIIAAEDHVEFQ